MIFQELIFSFCTDAVSPQRLETPSGLMWELKPKPSRHGIKPWDYSQD